MAHDFVNFPELTNAQMALYYFESPHRQIKESFTCDVTKVHDGDTITVRWKDRDFDFPVRIINIAAPELKESGGAESQSWLESILLGKEVNVIINPKNRVEKWGRLLGRIELDGLDVGDSSVSIGMSKQWSARLEGTIPSFNPKW